MYQCTTGFKGSALISDKFSSASISSSISPITALMCVGVCKNVRIGHIYTSGKNTMSH